MKMAGLRILYFSAHLIIMAMSPCVAADLSPNVIQLISRAFKHCMVTLEGSARDDTWLDNHRLHEYIRFLQKHSIATVLPTLKAKAFRKYARYTNPQLRREQEMKL